MYLKFVDYNNNNRLSLFYVLASITIINYKQLAILQSNQTANSDKCLICVDHDKRMRGTIVCVLGGLLTPILI